jgi:hypothetical protein
VLRLSRLRNINDIEAIVNNPGPVLGQRSWKARGVACLLERHVYLGANYSFHTNVLQITSEISGQSSWRALIISEFWEGKLGETIHSTKWLKLMEGKSTDLLKWIKENRDL